VKFEKRVRVFWSGLNTIREKHLHDVCARFPLLGRDGLGIQVKGDIRESVPKYLLSDFDVYGFLPSGDSPGMLVSPQLFRKFQICPEHSRKYHPRQHGASAATSEKLPSVSMRENLTKVPSCSQWMPKPGAETDSY
jgi:hypothetical protein